MKAFIVLSNSVLYLFKSEDLLDLLEVIPLYQPNNESGNTVKFAMVQYIDARVNNLFGSSNALRRAAVDSSYDFPESLFDLNAMRVNMLLLGEALDCFEDTFSEEVTAKEKDKYGALSALLGEGKSVSWLLHQLSCKPISIEKLSQALVSQSMVKNSSEAGLFLEVMVQRGFLSHSSPDLLKEAVSVTESSNTSASIYFSPPSLSSYNTIKGAEEYAFSIVFGDEKSPHSFRCFSSQECDEWILSCRTAVEQLWTVYLKGDSMDVDYKNLKLDSYFRDVTMRNKANGPTKVLLLAETKEAGDSYSKYALHEVSRVQMVAEASGFNISLMVEAVTVSIMDNDPSELVLLRLRDLSISIEQMGGEVARIATAITVQDVTMDNQLLSPTFSVAIYPRRTEDATSSGKLLQLHGLLQKGDQFPSLHIYFQQKLHFESGSIAGLLSGSKQYTDLLYFDIATLWVSPLVLNLEEEVLVRLVRLYQKIREQTGSKRINIGGNSKKAGVPFSLARGALLPASRQLESSSLRVYLEHESEISSARGIHFTILHLHPIDVVMSFRPSAKFQTSALEQSFIAVITQLNSARICLNALIVENAFGSAAFIMDVISKHYMYGMWKQIRVAIGSSDGFEGSVGLITNLGTGVYDLFYEPIGGLLGEKDGFLNGLSRGASSLASRTIGGTSAFTSQLTGTLGKGMSLLTLDNDFQHGRTMRRLNKSKNVAEGIREGTRDLGKNIMDGVVGVVSEPYKGWESGLTLVSHIVHFF